MIETLTLVQDQGRLLVRSSRPRRLGSLFLPKRRGYVLVLPSILFAAALLCWAIPSDAAMMTSACVVGAVSVYLMFDLLGRRKPLRISTVLAMTLGLGYGIGTVNTWYTLPRGSESLGEFLHISTVELAYGIASIAVSLALLLCLGELFETPLFGEDFELTFNNRAVFFLSLATATIAGSFLHGNVGFQGATGEGDLSGHIGYIASLIEWLNGSTLALAVCVALNVRGRFLRLYGRALAVLLFLLLLPLGRREMIYGVVLALLGLRLGRYKIPFSPVKKAVLLCLLAGLVYIASIAFFYMRVAGYALINPTLGQRIGAAVKLYEEQGVGQIKQQFSENVERRTFILGFLAELEGYTSIMPGGHGRDLLAQIELAIPSVLYPQKDIFFSEERLADELFGANYIDESNSVLTAGATDFGVWGVFIYPLLIVFVLRVFLELVAESIPVFVTCFVVLACCATVLQPETAVTSYIIIFRNTLVFGSIAWFIVSFPEFRLRQVIR